MLEKEKVKYSYNDIAVKPAKISNIEHRSECYPYDGVNYLPIFTAPMSSVIGEDNWKTFEDNKIHSIIPRSVDIYKRLDFLKNTRNIFIAFSLSEAEYYFIDEKNRLYLDTTTDKKYRILIDIANGHMKKLYDTAQKIKDIYGDNISIMAGNIANPETYQYIIENYPGVIDYIRLGVGSGQGCITSTNTSIHFPMASLIDECYEIKGNSLRTEKPKIVADGGIRNYNDVIKAIALGADYVMIGGLFSSCIESSAKTYILDNMNHYREATTDEIDRFSKKDPILYDCVYKKFYGMASKEGQIDLNGAKTHTSEGIAKYIKVKFRLSQWSENMADYMRSAMSYTNSKTLPEFRYRSKCIIISSNTYNSINK